MANSDQNVAVNDKRVNEETKLYRGVRKRKWGKYVSEIRLPNSRERIWLGSFDSPEKAARAFDAALFCLRGPSAKFNFPEDPPRIPEVDGLGPADIQAVAQHHANSCQTNNSSDNERLEQHDDAETSWASEINMSRSNGAGTIDSNIDWSLLDTFTYSDDYGGINPFETGGFHEPLNDMYIPLSQYFSSKSNDENREEDGNGNDLQHGNARSFLWNF